MAVTRNSNGTGDGAAGREVLEVASRIVRRVVAERIAAPSAAIDAVKERIAANGAPLRERIRPLPIQRSIDIAVPLEVAYEEWMKLEFLPEGAHRVEKIKRRGERLKGRITGAHAQHADWRAEVREERHGESFAWRSLKGSDCLGLVTFHRLSERLTRLEVELDVVPVRPAEAFELAVHIADRRTDVDLRRFKAQLERIDPDDYAALVGDRTEHKQADNPEEE